MGHTSEAAPLWGQGELRCLYTHSHWLQIVCCWSAWGSLGSQVPAVTYETGHRKVRQLGQVR